MVRLKHRSRRRGLNRDPGHVLVGTSKYQLDENGEVNVSDEDAKAMLQGAAWSQVAAAVAPAPTSKPQLKPGEVVVKDTVEISKPAAPPKPAPQPQPKAAPQPQKSEGDVRAELLREATRLGIKVDRRLSTQKIEQAIEAAKKRGDT